MMVQMSRIFLSVVVFIALAACTDSSREVVSSPSLDDLSSDGSGSGGDGDNESDEYSTREMLVAYIDEIVLPNYQDLEALTTQFSGSDGTLGAYCDAIGTADESSQHAAARRDWLAISDKVQASELHVIGPAFENGGSLQFRLNSYMAGPLSTCGVDGIAAQVEDGINIDERSLNQRGIGALEYLLFNDNLDHSCPPQAAATAQWNTLDERTRASQRCQAAQLIAGDMSAAAATLVDKWAPTAQDYRAVFLSEERVGESLQETTDAMFYLEEGAKDAKLGNPLGIVVACSALTCPEQIESPYSVTSLDNIIANVKAFRRIFMSNDETGFDAHLTAEGFPEVAERFINNLEASITYAESIEQSVTEQVAAIATEAEETTCSNAFANPDSPSEQFPLCTLYGKLKTIVDDLKIDFVTIVNVSIPGGSQSDND
jgi:predicted lipoprotein